MSVKFKVIVSKDGISVDVDPEVATSAIVNNAVDYFKSRGLSTTIAVVRSIKRGKPAGVLIFIPVDIRYDELKTLANQISTITV